MRRFVVLVALLALGVSASSKTPEISTAIFFSIVGDYDPRMSVGGDPNVETHDELTPTLEACVSKVGEFLREKQAKKSRVPAQAGCVVPGVR